jgi:hypothetical protein
VKIFDIGLQLLSRLMTLGMFTLSVWAITYATVGYAMYFILVAIFFHLEAAYYEKKEQVQA